jgi:plastocyanin
MVHGRKLVAIGAALALLGGAAVPVALARKVTHRAAFTAPSNGDLRFNHKRMTVLAGKVRLRLRNHSSVPHAIAIEGHGVDKKGRTVGKDGISRVTVRLKPGRYTFYCPVDGHRAAGMKGVLVVR